MRRRAGAWGIAHNDALTLKMRALGAERQRELREEASTQLVKFSHALRDFANKHRAQIKRDPKFRAAFHAMCASTGVDPLASRKSAWGEILGLSDWYAELAVVVASECVATRDVDGGVRALDAVVAKVNASRGPLAGDVSANDVERAIESLAVLGSGWRVATTPTGAKIIRSVPIELSDDVTFALERARATPCGSITATHLARASSWSRARASDALEAAVALELAFVDDQALDVGERLYWFHAATSVDLQRSTSHA